MTSSSSSTGKILITGANGFIGTNLCLRLKEKGISYSTFVRRDQIERIDTLISDVSFVVHLAGENRPSSQDGYQVGNVDLTRSICCSISRHFELTGRRVNLLFASSTQATLDNPYGQSKLEAEQILAKLSLQINNSCGVFRLPGVFGKWCKPNYNSVVATFCHNIVNDLPISVHDESTQLHLAHVDQVVDAFFSFLNQPCPGFSLNKITPTFNISVGELAEYLYSFKEYKNSYRIPEVGTGIMRALYSTYVSYLTDRDISTDLVAHADKRGVFTEMLKTSGSGQISYFTAHPGVTRGGHYHHTKTEKFLVIKGNARFRFRHVITHQYFETCTSGSSPTVVDTVPGWAHDITNIGDEEMIVIVWAHELFDPSNPDTFVYPI